jgi:hypothetical protein
VVVVVVVVVELFSQHCLLRENRRARRETDLRETARRLAVAASSRRTIRCTRHQVQRSGSTFPPPLSCALTLTLCMFYRSFESSGGAERG